MDFDGKIIEAIGGDLNFNDFFLYSKEPINISQNPFYLYKSKITGEKYAVKFFFYNSEIEKTIIEKELELYLKFKKVDYPEIVKYLGYSIIKVNNYKIFCFFMENGNGDLKSFVDNQEKYLDLNFLKKLITDFCVLLKNCFNTFKFSHCNIKPSNIIYFENYGFKLNFLGNKFFFYVIF